eukprot:15464746-Alexandrium_andersonii.AAC.1
MKTGILHGSPRAMAGNISRPCDCRKKRWLHAALYGELTTSVTAGHITVGGFFSFYDPAATEASEPTEKRKKRPTTIPREGWLD